MGDVHAAARAAGMITNPSGTERLHEYWVRGPGAAKIRWGSPGDFDRCVEHISKFIHDAKGYCNLAHHSALGFYPATHAAMEHAGRTAMADTKTSPGGSGGASRSEILRFYPLDDIRIVSRADGDGTGRVVEAYAAVFDEPAEIKDHEGHYEESIDRGAFDQVLARIQRTRGGLASAVRVLYNHGQTMHGQEAPEFQKPLGKPLDVRPDGRGLLTRTEYGKTPLAEEILEMIRGGSITAQSFVGGILQSDPQLKGPGDRYRARNGALTRVRRLGLGLREYGPVLYAAYPGAEFLGVRMGTPELANSFDPPEDEEYTPETEGDVTGGAPEDATSARYHQHALYAMRSRELREREGLVW
jgi:HK97 family phage prohead protease